MSGSRTTWMAVLVGAALAAACGSKEPTCPAGQTLCGGVCVDTTTDPNNCHFCSVRCPTGASCVSSLCQCPAGQVPCGGACITLDTNQNCGACGHVCDLSGTGALGTCSGSACTCAAAPVLDCGTTASPQCVNGSTDQSNCGVCGHACGLGGCTGGVCTCNTDPGVLDCGSSVSPQCVNTLTDPNNCGGCGTRCTGSTPICSAGHCCGFGESWCGAACVNTSSDPNNCGACGAQCTSPTPTCDASHCCPTSFSWCGGPTCVNEQTDPANCGICGHTCSASQACVGGVCQCQAPTPLACGANCCAGTQCCSGNTTCQALHSNGLGQTFYDCSPLGTPGDPVTYNQAMASGAAAAWSAGTDQLVTCTNSSCLCRTTSTAIQDSAVWCYTGTLAGYVGHSSVATPNCLALCPYGKIATWQ